MTVSKKVWTLLGEQSLHCFLMFQHIATSHDYGAVVSSRKIGGELQIEVSHFKALSEHSFQKRQQSYSEVENTKNQASSSCLC